MQFSVFSVQREVRNEQFVVCSVQCICTMFRVLFVVCSMQCAVCFFVMCSMQCAVCSLLQTTRELPESLDREEQSRSSHMETKQWQKCNLILSVCYLELALLNKTNSVRTALRKSNVSFCSMVEI